MTIATDPSTWRRTTAGGIPYKLVSLTGQFSEEDATATEVVIVKANQLLAFAKECLPAPWVAIGGLFYPPRRRLPGLSPLYVKRLSWKANVDGMPIDPFGADASAPTTPTDTYERDLEVTVEYGTSPGNDSDPDPNDPTTFLEVEAHAAGSFLNSPIRGDARWEQLPNSPLVVGSPVTEADITRNTMIEPLVEWTVRWSQIPQSYFTGTLITRLRNATGLVNSAAMPMFINAPAETILLTTWSVKQQFTWRTGASGQPPVQLEMQFIDKNFTSQDTENSALGNAAIQVTHNHTYRASASEDTATNYQYRSGYRRLLLNGTDLQFRSTDLSAIFLP